MHFLVTVRRLAMSAKAAESIISNTPDITSSGSSVFRRLDKHGLISCSEYLFFLSILTRMCFSQVHYPLRHKAQLEGALSDV